MALTLLEAAKLYDGDMMRQGIIQAYAGSSSIMQNLQFMNIPGGSISYIQEKDMPDPSFRGFNEAFSQSYGSFLNQTETIKMMGGDIEMDISMNQTNGGINLPSRITQQVRSMGLKWTSKFFKGDSAADPREFDGLQKRIVDAQKISAGSTSGGDALSLIMLDSLIDQVDSQGAQENRVLVMNKTVLRRLNQASRTTSVGGFITYSQDQFGRRMSMYNGIPILTVDLDQLHASILPFSEAGAGGGSSFCTSVYCLSLSESGVVGIQNDSISVRDLGEMQSKPSLLTRVDWLSSFCIFDPRAAARLYGIKDAAVVA